MMENNNYSKEHMNYLSVLKKKTRMITISRVLILVFALIVWEISASLNLIDKFLFSSPISIAKTFVDMAVSGEIFIHTLVTLIETIVAFALSTSLGIVIAILLWYSSFLEEVLEPYVVLLNSIPKTALAPIIIVWFGNNYRAIIVTAISIGIFVTVISMLSAIKETDTNKIRLITVLGGSRGDILTKVILPANKGTIISVSKSNIGLSLVGVIIGEFLASQRGLGYLIMYGSQIFRMDWVILSLVILSILAYVFYIIISSLGRSIDNL